MINYVSNYNQIRIAKQNDKLYKKLNPNGSLHFEQTTDRIQLFCDPQNRVFFWQPQFKNRKPSIYIIILDILEFQNSWLLLESSTSHQI